MRCNLWTYHRRIQIAAFFEGKSTSPVTPFTPRSCWIPATGQIPELINQIIQTDWQYFNHKFKLEKKIGNWRKPPNLTKAEIKELKSLRQNKSTVIKPADKGNVVVIQDRFQYLGSEQTIIGS